MRYELKSFCCTGYLENVDLQATPRCIGTYCVYFTSIFMYLCMEKMCANSMAIGKEI